LISLRSTFLIQSENASHFMKPTLFCLMVCLVGTFLPAQHQHELKHDLELRRITGASFDVSPLKMPCDPSAGLSIISCEGETPATGDNLPENGAFMTWAATGANLFYSRIYSPRGFTPFRFGVYRTSTETSSQILTQTATLSDALRSAPMIFALPAHRPTYLTSPLTRATSGATEAEVPYGCIPSAPKIFTCERLHRERRRWYNHH